MSHILMYEALDIETLWDNNIAKPICISITNNNKIKFKRTEVDKIDNDEILDFLLENCSSKKIYYVHNLTFEIFVFLKYLIRRQIKFKIVSADRNVYSAEIWYINKKIKLRCSYKLTMLSLKKLSELCENNKKGIFPYSILNINSIKEITFIKENMFKTNEDYIFFINSYGKKIKTFKVLEEYCKNDALITKESITKYWKIIEESGLVNNNRILTAAKLSVENFFLYNSSIKKKYKLSMIE